MLGTELIAGYRRAGNDFLADRLEGMFRLLKTPEDVGLHNAIVTEVLLMVGSDTENVNRFYRLLAERILAKQATRTFRQIVAAAIFGGARA